jgi:hypothetical protein
MPGISKDTATQVEDHGAVVDRHEDVGGYTINFVTFRATVDGAPLLRGLPGDRCHCPHWGYVLAGRVGYRFGERDEVFEAGDAFYVPAGHTPWAEAGSEIVQFSPAAELAEVEATMRRNMQAMSR